MGSPVSRPGRPAGPVLIGLAGPELARREAECLRHPAVGGVVLFTRNYASPAQLRELTAAIRGAADAPMLICVDHEGGRVQRFRAGFTALPPLAVLGRMHADAPDLARDFAYRHARVMATELLVQGVDLSFAPVLDLDGPSRVIGDRAFAGQPAVVADLARHYLAGMHDAGMKACGKHFPGHGSVVADSHTHDVTDERELAALAEHDLQPFKVLLEELDSLMMAHVCYPSVDPDPAGYSARWIRELLRQELGYRGTVFSDDLGMHAARVAGKLADRVRRSLEAGCDAVLICDPRDSAAYLDQDRDLPAWNPAALTRLQGVARVSAEELLQVGEWRHWQSSLRDLEQSKWT